jgi:diadenosine tetraphosphate (Ap4A) HIT family hydrolase
MLYSEFLTTMTECPFCSGTHNRVLAEREHAYLTYAYAPYHKHHLLVVPRRHVLSINDLTPEEEKEIDELQHLGLETLQKLGYVDVTLMVREGNVNENKSIDHTHYHVVPSVRIGDLDHEGNKRRTLTDEEVTKTIHDIQNVLPH